MSVSPKTVLLAVSFAGIVVAPCFASVREARAQATPPPLTVYPPCTTKPTAQDSEAAHSAFLLGKRFFEESDYASASHNFMDAFKLDCTKPDLLLNIARANELLGNRAEAIHALETYLTLKQLDPDDKAQTQRRIDNLKAAMAAQAAPVVVAPAPTPAPPPPAPAPAPAPTAAPTEERHHTVWPWVVAGVGGAAVIAGGVMYLVGNGDVSTAEQTCPGGVCANAKPGTTLAEKTSAASQGSTGDTLKSAGAGVFWAGLAVAGGGVLWHFLEPTGPAKESGAKASLSPVVAPGYGGLAAVGTF